MGMYTHCRGWIELELDSINREKFEKLMIEAQSLSPRACFCVGSTVFKMGSNFCPYIFIGGELKNYDNDWETFLEFLFNKLKIINHNIETKYEEDEGWIRYSI